MARTDQRAIPIALFVIALVLVAARIAMPFLKDDAPKDQNTVQWVTPEEGMRLAAGSGKPVLLDFTADWCTPCHVLDAQVFRDPAIARRINERFVPIRVLDRQREEGRNAPAVAELQQRFEVRGFPTVIFVDRTGRPARMEGFQGREEFERMMESVR